MIDRTIAPLDPACLAEEVRDLANDAHRVLNSPATQTLQIDDLTRRVTHLQDQIRGYPFDELASWLDNVRQLIEAS